MAKLTIELGATIGKLKRGLANARAELKGWSKRIKGLATIAFTVTAGAFFATANKIITKADDIAKASKRIGFSAEEFQKLAFAARRAGATNEDVEKSVRRMQGSIVDLEQGLSTAKDAFGALGLAVDDLKGLSPEKQFEVIADRLAAVEDATLKSALAQDLFGRSGTKLIPLLDSYRELKQEAEDLGGIMSNDVVKAAEDLKDSAENLQTGLMGLVANSGVVQWLNEVTKKAAEAASAIRKLDAGGFGEGETLTLAAPTAEEIRKAAQEGLSSRSQGGGLFTGDVMGAMKETGAIIGVEIGKATAKELESNKGRLSKTVSDAVADGLDDLDWKIEREMADLEEDALKQVTNLGVAPNLTADIQRAALQEGISVSQERARELEASIAQAFRPQGEIASGLARIGGERGITLARNVPERQLSELQAIRKGIDVMNNQLDKLDGTPVWPGGR